MNSNRSWITFVVIFLILAVVTGALYTYHSAQNKSQALKHARSDHAIVVTTRADYATGWYRERVSDARFIFDSQFKSYTTQEFVFADSGFSSLSMQVLWMGAPFGNASYTQAVLIDTLGHVLYSRPTGVSFSESERALAAKRICGLDSVAFFLNTTPDGSAGYFHIFIPFFGPQDSTRAARGAILKVEFDGYLNTLISGPQISSNTRVSFIAQADGDSVKLVPCNRHFTTPYIPAVLAQESIDLTKKNGRVTAIRGMDMEGRDVLVAATSADRFPWPIVVVQNLDAATQIYRLQANLVGALLLVFLTISGTSLFFLTRRSRKELKSAEAEFERDKSIVETKLQDRSAVYKLLFDKSLDAILVVAPEGRIEAVNPAACAMFDASEEELLRSNRTDVMDLADPRSIHALKVRTERGWYQGEAVLVRKNGTKFIAEVSTNKIIDSAGEEKIHVLARDISESYKIREELERRALHLHESQRVGRLGSWEANLRTGNVHWSENLYRILGRDANLGPLTVAQTLNVIIGADQFKGLEGFLEQAEWQEMVSGRNSMSSIDGHPIVYQYSIKVIQGAQNKVEQLFGSVVDVTELANAEREVRSLIAHLVSAREEERTKVARDIHDELGQMLTAVKIDLSTLGRGLSSSDATRRERIDTTLSLVDSMIQTVKRLTAELRPGILDDLGLSAAIEWQLKQFSERTEIKHHFDFTFAHDDVDRELSTTLFRIAQEALTNVARHSQASRVDVRVSTEADDVVLTVLDNGIGIPPEAAHDSGSFGLLSIQERAAYFGGTAAFETVKNGGTLVIVRIPTRKEVTRDSSYRC